MLKAKGESTYDIKIRLDSINEKLKKADEKLKCLQSSIENIMLNIPNIPHESVPEGKSEADNKVIRLWGEKKSFDFQPQDHVTLGEKIGLDFDAGVKLSGTRFAVMRGTVAKLHRALAQFMLDIQTNEHGYEQCYIPYLVHGKALQGTGQLPKFEEDMFKTQIQGQQESHYLISTAEISLTNLVNDTILEESELPIRLTAHTPCFRKEAGSYGRDTRGMIRQHQFDKVEIVQIVNPDQSFTVLEEMLIHAETILQRLKYSISCCFFMWW